MVRSRGDPVRHIRRDESAPVNPQRRVLVILAAVFFVPVGFSFYMYYGHSALEPAKRVNHGDLVSPPRPLPSVTLTRAATGSAAPTLFKHKWTYLYVGDGRCESDCRKALYDTRQVRLALDRDMDRVQRVFLAGGECCDYPYLNTQQTDLIVIRQDAASQPLLAILGENTGPVTSGRIYLIDPLGNLMMSYAHLAAAKGMLEDMKRLLTLSHIG
jgi:hypothetical protein